MSNILTRLLKNESGATAIEYGLIAALVSLSIVVGATSIGNQLSVTFNSISTSLYGAMNN